MRKTLWRTKQVVPFDVPKARERCFCVVGPKQRDDELCAHINRGIFRRLPPLVIPRRTESNQVAPV